VARRYEPTAWCLRFVLEPVPSDVERPGAGSANGTHGDFVAEVTALG
jgi:hypothetical protein